MDASTSGYIPTPSCVIGLSHLKMANVRFKRSESIVTSGQPSCQLLKHGSTQNKCVVLCTNSKQKQPCLTFLAFPRDDERKRTWTRAVRRDEGPLFNVDGARICSIHFCSSDLVTTASGLTKIKKDAMPFIFPWSVTNL